MIVMSGKSELSIFDKPDPPIVVQNASFEEIFPINTITGESTDIEFKVNASNTDYLDLNDTLLYVSVKVVQENGADLADGADVCPNDYFFHSLFKDVMLKFNSVLIEGGNSTYAQKAIICSVLNYSKDTEKMTLTSMGSHANEVKRKAWIAKSKNFEMCGSILLDFFNQPKYLIPGISVHLRLQRNPSSFCIKGSGKVLLNDAKLFVRRVKVTPSVLMGHNIGLQKRNAIYPIRQTRLNSYNVAKGSLAYFKDQIFDDRQLPKFVLVTFQPTKSYNGDKTEFSSKFDHSSVSSIMLSRNTDYRESYTVDFENDRYVTSYVQSIIRNMNLLNKNINIGINMENFKDRYPFFTFVLAPDFDVNQTQVPRQGNIRLDVRFSKAIVEATTVLIYGVFDSEVEISDTRNIKREK